MGVYDTVLMDDRTGQVKCWGRGMGYYSTGSSVPELYYESKEVPTYSVAMREGGFINVFNRRLISWTDKPLFKDVFDKYGERFTDKTQGLFGEELGTDPYLFKD